MKTFILWLACLSLTACASHPKPIEVAPAKPFAYQIPGAPIAGSPEDQSDYKTLLDLQHTRNPDDCTRGRSEVKISLGSFYGPPYGPLSYKEVANLTHLFEVVVKDAWPLIGSAKQNWKRPRPFITHKDLHPCAKLEGSYSYPSGHSALAHYYMHILTDIYPNRKAAFEKRAEEIAHDRNLVGVHYPSDVRDGKLMGDQIYDYLAQDKKFKDLLEPAVTP
jgi:acid phosphatase (class A)